MLCLVNLQTCDIWIYYKLAQFLMQLPLLQYWTYLRQKNKKTYTHKILRFLQPNMWLVCVQWIPWNVVDISSFFWWLELFVRIATYWAIMQWFVSSDSFTFLDSLFPSYPFSRAYNILNKHIFDTAPNPRSIRA